MNIQVELSGVDINFGSHYHRDSMSWNWLRSFVIMEDLRSSP